MNVLSLFDGMSCGRIALERAGIKVDNYYSSEIDKYAIQVADKNYPQDGDKRLGSVIDLDEEYLKSLDIDLLIGGSPCQGFSMAGKMKGSSTKCGKDVTTLEQYLVLKDMGFEFDGQSYLFWEYIRVMRAIKPKYFFLENVRITKKWLPMFNEAMGVEPTRINSSLVSAQNRDRYYWHNFGEIPQPEDKGILLRDILETNVEDKFTCGEAQTNKMIRHNNKITKTNKNPNKPGCIHAGYFKGGGRDQQYIIVERPCKLKDFNENSTCHHIADATDIKGNKSIKRVYAESGKSPAMTTCQGGHREPKVLVNESIDKEGKAYCVTARYSGAVAWNSCERKQRTMVVIEPSEEKDPNVYNGARYRKLTPLECERLQTLGDNYTLVLGENNKQIVSNSQRYKMIGNGWTVDVIAHIFKGLNRKGK